MLKTLFHFVIFSLCAAFLIAAPETQAQDITPQYDPDYRPDFLNDVLKDEDELLIGADVISTLTFRVSTIRLENASDNDLTLSLISPTNVSGCMTISDPTVKDIKYSGKSVRVEIDLTRINVKDSDTAYTQDSCDIQMYQPSLNITLNKQQLIENAANKIQITYKKAPIFIFKTDINKDRAVFIMPIENVVASGNDPTNGKNMFIHWFYPDNTLILYNSKLRLDNKDNIKKIAAFAKRRGLIPITDFLPDFRVSANNRHKMYFVDVNGAYAAQLKNAEDITTLGNVERTEMIHTSKGLQEKIIETPIYVKRPSLYE